MTRSGEELALEARVDDAPPEYRFRTADGVCSKDAFRPAELLLADALWEDASDRLLVLEGNYGVVPTVLAGAAGRVAVTESSARAANLCERNAASNDADVDVSLVADPASVGGEFDAVAYAPKPYTPLDVAAQRIANAAELLAPGGRVYVAAADDAGASRYESYLGEVLGDASEVLAHDRCRVLRATRSEAPGAGSAEAPTYVEARALAPTVDGVDLELVSVPGLFAASALDHGTRLLAETVAVADGDRVLDLCCGYGALGAYAAASADCEVWLTDDDRVATACAECSLDATGVEGTVVTADGANGVRGRTFDTILSNPPTHAGDGVLRELFAGARDVLAADGELWAVHHRDLDLRRHLSAFETIEEREAGEEHVVLRVF
ncbi:methyltransferase [Halobacterium litoreum]|uniref:Methyltransferase n=1 Tax=Halobacterium litoreum TaxID=2039234 RepID=A0ABD5NC33_9EURY|nr:methyltransferase [Halobacterium litoreum]UHH14422.1 methyltransferase [Halobacterium litoreum]